MGHFAEIDENNIVLRVLVDHHSGTETERINFFKSLFGDDTNWVKTSYNTEGGKGDPEHIIESAKKWIK